MKKGEHKIKLSYVTPGLKIGIVLSSIGWIITVFLFVLRKNNKCK